MTERDDHHGALRLDFAPSTKLVEAIDAVTDMMMHLEYAEGLARVCLAAQRAQELRDEDLTNVLWLLSTYLQALRQGMDRWQDATPPGTPLLDTALAA
jgi:hypothetical protein